MTFCDSGTCESETCEVETGRAESCGSEACGVITCGGETCGVVSCGAEACGVVFCGAETCGAETCGAETCGVASCRSGLDYVRSNTLEVSALVTKDVAEFVHCESIGVSATSKSTESYCVCDEGCDSSWCNCRSTSCTVVVRSSDLPLGDLDLDDLPTLSMVRLRPLDLDLVDSLLSLVDL